MKTARHRFGWSRDLVAGTGPDRMGFGKPALEALVADSPGFDSPEIDSLGFDKQALAAHLAEVFPKLADALKTEGRRDSPWAGRLALWAAWAILNRALARNG